MSQSQATSGQIFGVAEALRRDGFQFLLAVELQPLLDQVQPVSTDEWDAFASSWNEMPQDTYMGDGGRYRRRRFAVFSAQPELCEIARAPHAPHYQTTEYNSLNGGIARWFEAIPAQVTDGAAFARILEFCRNLFDTLLPGSSWHIETHQFRIEANANSPGQPTPEGAHRDGVDWVLVLLVSRINVAQGKTTVYDLEGQSLGSFTLTGPLDVALVDDKRVLHGVTPVVPLDPTQPGHRDVLIVTFRRISID